ncbi:FAD-dependent oxidoreductase [Actinopolymorpha sp. B9G3]|uniref:phytoene desaturase family protein n=1 Tax=Actinopolymorpha sp. B9G3 TaxID=3158970 RepID=UPI0032D97C05
MARVVVIGGGLGGLAAAARLAKLGHAVTLLERSSHLGGVVRTAECDDPAVGRFRWDAGPAAVTLPATLRDLFRKSGRPLERVLELAPLPTPRRHVFSDGTALDLPVGSRSGQRRAVEAALGSTTGAAWEAVVDELAPTWELLRTRVLEVPFSGVGSLGPTGVRVLVRGRSLRAFARRRLTDVRARKLLEYPVLATGSGPADAPSFTAVRAYVERTFGIWTCAGGFGALVDALGQRLDERAVTVRLEAEAVAIRGDGAVTGVELRGGERLAADVVVSGVDVRTVARGLLARPPRAMRRSARTLRDASPPPLVHVGLADAADDLPHETVFHGDDARESPTVVVRAPDDPSLAPAGHRAVSIIVHRNGGTGTTADPLELLARRGWDIRDRVVARVDGDATSYGPAWRGAVRGLGVARNHTAVRGLFMVGATAHPGPGVPEVLLGAAAVATEIGRA